MKIRTRLIALALSSVTVGLFLDQEPITETTGSSLGTLGSAYQRKLRDTGPTYIR